MIKVANGYVKLEGDPVIILDEIFNLISALGCMCRDRGISDKDMIERIVEVYTRYDSTDDMRRQKKAEKEILDEIYSLIK